MNTSKTMRKEVMEGYVDQIQRSLEKGIDYTLMTVELLKTNPEPKELKQYKNEAIESIGEYLRRQPVSFQPARDLSDYMMPGLKRVVDMFGIEPKELKQYKNEAIGLTGKLFSDTRPTGAAIKCLEDAVEMFSMKSEEDLQPLKGKALKQIDELYKSEGISDYISYIIDVAKILGIGPKELKPYKREVIDRVGGALLSNVMNQDVFDTLSEHIKWFGIEPKDLKQYRSKALEEAYFLFDRKRVIDALRLAKMFGIAEIKEGLIEDLAKILNSLMLRQGQ